MRSLAILIALCVPGVKAQAQQVTPSDTVGGILRQDIDQRELEAFEQRIRDERLKRREQEKKQAEVAESEGPSVLIERIDVEGLSILSMDQIRPILEDHQGQELNMAQINRLAGQITAIYREEGYVTSRAIIPPQDMQDGVLTIQVVEGELGDIEIRGNKHFKTPLLQRKLDISGEQRYFDYSKLQRSMAYINEHPDREARAILVPGKEPRTTDIIIDVEDQSPIHVGFEYDNHVSRFIKSDRFGLFLEHNNVTGNDDRLEIKGYLTDGRLFKSGQFRYSYPVNPGLKIGIYGLHSETELGREFKILEAEGEARLYGVFAIKDLVKNEDIEVRLNTGFDYKDIKNYLAGNVSSHDELRVLKAGVDIDVVDRFGRSILTTELHAGIPDILGGSSSKDTLASRTGAGGRFEKASINLFRLQPMPFDTYVLWKNSGQFTNRTLPASEQFQIGGAKSVRGYAPAEHSGDSGYYGALEWSFPVWGLSRDLTVPFRAERMYDALRLVTFYDLGLIHNNNPGAGEESEELLQGYGFGARFNLLDDTALRVEVGFPINGESSDGNDHQTWVELKVRF